MLTIKLKDVGTVLSSREAAKQISRQAEENNFNVIFDFSGIKFIGTSFADELFAKPLTSGIHSFKIKNIEDDTIKKTIIFVTESRRHKALV